MSGVLSKNQKCDFAEYKTKLLNIGQMELIQNGHESNSQNEFKFSRSILSYGFKDLQINAEQNNGLNIFKFNNDLSIANLPFSNNQNWKQRLTDEHDNQASTSAINNDEFKEASHPKDSSIKNCNNEHEIESEIIDKPSSPLNFKKRVFKDLHSRLDVVNKTFVRSIKRYYDSVCCGNKRIKSHTNVEAVSQACNLIDRIWKTNFKDYFKISEIDTTPSTFSLLTCKDYDGNINGDAKYADLKLLIGCMTMPDVLKVYMKTKTRKNLFILFSNTIYKYSHKNMIKLMENRTFEVILDQYVKSPAFELMLRTDNTLKRYPDLYRQKGQSLIQNLKKENS